MENAITAALSKQIALSRALDVAANNVANQTTTGFKTDRVNFKEYVTYIENPDGGDPTVSLVYDAETYTDFSPGGLEATRAPLDFAIEGSGFFAVQTDAGVRYTRDGHFGLNVYGELVTRDGAQVLDDSGAPILIDPEAGPIVMSPEGELQQKESPVARLGVFQFDDVNTLRKAGNNLFAAETDTFVLADSQLRQGFVEISNVSPVRAMTEMIDILRAYENAAQVIETASELSSEAVQTLTEAA